MPTGFLVGQSLPRSFICCVCLYMCNFHHPRVIRVDCGFLCLQWFIIYYAPCLNQVFFSLVQLEPPFFGFFFSSWLTFFERFCTLTWDKDPWASALGSDSFPGSQCFSEVGQCIVGHRQTYETTQTCICAHARIRMHTHEHNSLAIRSPSR